MSGDIILVPWYEPGDYYQFRSMNGGTAMPPRYEEWLDGAVHEVTQLLARGRTTQIVRLKPEDYFLWLSQRCAPDSPEERAAYLAVVHGSAGCPVEPGLLPPNWPQRPAMH